MRTVVGIHAAKEVLKVRPNAIREIWLKAGFEKVQELQFFSDWAKRNKVKCQSKPEGVFNQIAASHQGVAIQVSETPSLNLEALCKQENALLIALDEISDPHNVGAILRSAWLLGVHGILAPKNRAAHLTPAAMKVASGGAEHVPMMVIDNLASTLSDLKDKGFWIYGLDGESRQICSDVRFNEKVVLVIGAEDKGLRSTTRNVCDELVALQQMNSDASFNASVAAALVTYEVTRQHKNP